MDNVPEEIKRKIEKESERIVSKSPFKNNETRTNDWLEGFESGAEYGHSLLNEKEVPEITVYRWVKCSERMPNTWHLKIARFIHTKISVNDAEHYAKHHPELIEWLEPVPLKELLK